MVSSVARLLTVMEVPDPIQMPYPGEELRSVPSWLVGDVVDGHGGDHVGAARRSSGD
jgi:hypothetical protein